MWYTEICRCTYIKGGGDIQTIFFKFKLHFQYTNVQLYHNNVNVDVQFIHVDVHFVHNFLPKIHIGIIIGH